MTQEDQLNQEYKYICNNCGALFNEPDIVAIDDVIYEECCPECLSSDFETIDDYFRR